MISVVKIAIIQFPGSNTERETFLAVQRAGMKPVEFLWNNDHNHLDEYNGFIITGGFSYEDRSRAGVIASLDTIVNKIKKQAEIGKPVLGICNGAQILVESGMVPGLENYRLGIALTNNKRVKDGHVLGTGYYNVWTNLKLAVSSNRTAFTRHLNGGGVITIPLAHSEGRFVIPDELLDYLINNNQTVFRYCDDDGIIHNEFPINPNGSVYNIAALCNPDGNVMAIMPHPERTTNGDAIFTSMRDYIEESVKFPRNDFIDYIPGDIAIPNYLPAENRFEFLVDLIITDNEAVTVENALQHLGMPVRITRQSHWEIETDVLNPDQTKSAIIKSSELFNSNKERLTTYIKLKNSVSFLVRSKDDFTGQHKLEALKHWFGIRNIQTVKSGVLWTITSEKGDIEDVVKRVLGTHILFNRYSHDCYRYGE